MDAETTTIKIIKQAQADKPTGPDISLGATVQVNDPASDFSSVSAPDQQINLKTAVKENENGADTRKHAGF